MQLFIEPAGTIRCLYGEELDLQALGKCTIRRASHVEPTSAGKWIADLSAVAGPLLGPFARHSDALNAEYRWIEEKVLSTSAMTF